MKMNTQLADTIAMQMGGVGRLKVMLGATVTALLNDSNEVSGLRIKFPNRCRSKGNCVDIKLMPSDTYKVTFYNLAKLSAKVVKEVEDVYCDQLVELFETQTGYLLRI